MGRQETPSAAVIDSQSVKTGAKRGRFMALTGESVTYTIKCPFRTFYSGKHRKKVKGRKRHIIVDTQGLLLAVIVTEANMSERLGALALLLELDGRLPRLALIWVEQGYQSPKFARTVQQLAGVSVEVISRQSKEFQVLPRRWVVERTFAWFNQNRRLIVDSELLPEVSETTIYVAMIRLMLKRLTKRQYASASSF